MLLVIGLLVALGVGAWFWQTPSHDRTWELGHESLPTFEQNGNLLLVKNFRNFYWTGEATATPRYEEREFDLAKIRGVEVFISHFSDFEGLAHIFLSFGFEGGEQLVVSLETRREVGETFSPFLGLLNQFEIIYVVGSEEDIVGARTAWRGERVYRYPTVATADQAKALLLKLAEDVNGVAVAPRFYNTLFHNCTNELTRRVEEMSSAKFPLTWKALLPGYFDEVLFEMGLLATSEDSFEATKEAALIDSESASPEEPYFSQTIRGEALPADASLLRYTDLGIGIALTYDAQMTLDNSDPLAARFYQWGPTQKGQTELYDGMTVTFRRVAFTGPFTTYMKDRVAGETGTITQPLKAKTFAGYPVQTYGVSALGDFTIIVVPVTEQEAIEIATMAPDPTNAGFQKTIDQLLATVKILEPEEEELETEVLE